MPFNPNHFQLHRVNDTQWLIHHTDYPPTDPQHAVAFVEQIEGDLTTVVWLRGTPLPTQYPSPDAVLADLRVFSNQESRSTRPINIPHFPPAAPSGQEPQHGK
ncbi:MAG: hypothetical protein KDB08_07935 [Microthrixaceae bacterium]|nr:hypothetical protein [Microthrixaceae bacterium]